MYRFRFRGPGFCFTEDWVREGLTTRAAVEGAVQRKTIWWVMVCMVGGGRQQIQYLNSTLPAEQFCCTLLRPYLDIQAEASHR